MALDGGGTFQLGDVAAASKELVGIGDHGVGCASEDSRRYDMMREFESVCEYGGTARIGSIGRKEGIFT